jgi:putative endonuclease
MRLDWLKEKIRRASPAPDTGRWGEQQAERMLAGKGYRILGRRVKVGRRDEIDLVARQGDILVFVEVKTRRREDFGRPADFVDRRKRQVQSRAAVRYLKRLGYPRICFRFDVVEVVGSVSDAAPTVRHIEKAFELDRKYRLP